MQLDAKVAERLHEGTVIPALPLALDAKRQFDRQRQRALCRYYVEAGCGGLAVGVHTTQFEIRQPGIDLYVPVLETAIQELKTSPGQPPLVKVAGICGPTAQAVAEAEIAFDLGYDLGLLSMGGLDDYSEEALLERAEQVGQVLPLFGFYLQPAVGGRVLSYAFWRRFADNPAVQAIKVAPFDRYYTIDVMRAVCNSPRRDSIAMYTGNDDNIVVDLLTRFAFDVNGETVTKGFAGGLLGHWAFWAKSAVDLLAAIKEVRDEERIPAWLLQRAVEITDVNAAVFDAANAFAGCIPGIHEVLRRQGLMTNVLCLEPSTKLSPAQKDEIDRVYAAYPHLNDDAFVAAHRPRSKAK